MQFGKVVGSIAAVILASAIVRAEEGSISGKVAFEGEAPKMKKLKVDADPQCAAMHADKPLMGEQVVVNANGTLKNVFVYIKSGAAATEYPKTPVTINQEGCTY